MNHLRQAIAQNEEGIDFLASGQTNEALWCFRSALALVAALPAQDGGSTETLGDVRGTQRSLLTNPIVVTPTADEVLFVLPHPSALDLDMSCDSLSLISVALVFNSAVAWERKARSGGDQHTTTNESELACYQKVTHLYGRCLQLLALVHQGHHCIDCTETIHQVVRRMAAIHFKLGDYASVRGLLDVLLEMEFSSAVFLIHGDDADEEDGPKTHAPMA